MTTKVSDTTNEDEKIRDFVFFKMRQTDVEFMKGSLRHLVEQLKLGLGPTYTSAPWVLVMVLPLVSFVITIVLRSPLASLILSTALSFVLFIRIYAANAQYPPKVARLKEKLNRCNDKLEHMQEEIDVAGQELKESVREQLRLNQYSTMLAERIAELEGELKRFQSLGRNDTSPTKRPSGTSPNDHSEGENHQLASRKDTNAEAARSEWGKETVRIIENTKEERDCERTEPKRFKHRKRGETQIIKHYVSEDQYDVDSDDEGRDNDSEMASERGISAGRQGLGTLESVFTTKYTDSLSAEEKQFHEFAQKMHTLRERDRQASSVSERGPELSDEQLTIYTRDDSSTDQISALPADVDEDSTEEEIEDEEENEGESFDIGSEATTITHRPRIRNPDEVEASFQVIQRQLSARENSTIYDKEERLRRSRSMSRDKRSTVHLASSISSSGYGHSSISPLLAALSSSNSCIPVISSTSDFSSFPAIARRGAEVETFVPPIPPPQPPPVKIPPQTSSRFSFPLKFFHMPRRHSSQASTLTTSSVTALTPSPLGANSTVMVSPPASPRALSSSSPTNTRPLGNRRRGDSLTNGSPPAFGTSKSNPTSPALENEGSPQSSFSSSPPKFKRGSMLLSLIPFAHDKGGKEAQSAEDDQQVKEDDDGDSSPDEESSPTGNLRKLKKKGKSLIRIRSKDEERNSKREEKDKLKEEKKRLKAEEKEESKKDDKEHKKRLVDGVKRLYHRRTRSTAGLDLDKFA